jgi:hypothetical protein
MLQYHYTYCGLKLLKHCLMKHTRGCFAFLSPLDASSVVIISRFGSVMKHMSKYTAGRGM